MGYYVLCKIGSTDFGSGGVGFLRKLRVRPPSGGGVQLADIWLEIPGGGGYDFKAMTEVQVSQWDAGAGLLAHRWFGGFVRRRAGGKVPANATRMVRLRCVSYGHLFDRLVAEGGGSGLLLAAGTVQQQLASLLVQLRGAGTRGIDLAVGASVAGIALGPKRYYGKTFREIVTDVCKRAEYADTSKRVRFHMGLDLAVPATAFNNPYLRVYDVASPPPAVLAFSDAPSGLAKPLYGLERIVEARDLVNRRQSRWAETGGVYTAEDTASKTAYPNPFDARNAWGAGRLADAESMTAAQAQTFIDRRVEVSANPTDRVVLRTPEWVAYGEWVEVTHALEGLAGEAYQVQGMDVDFAEPNRPWSVLYLGLDPGLPIAEGDADPPDPPAALTVAYNRWDEKAQAARVRFTWSASPSDDVSEYWITLIVGASRYEVPLGNVLEYIEWFAEGQAVDWKVRAVDGHDNHGADADGPDFTSATRPLHDKLFNPGFEFLDPADTAQAQGWTGSVAGGTGAVGVDTSDPYEGAYAFKLQSDGAGVTSKVVSERVGCAKGETFIVTPHHRSSAAAAVFGVWVNVYDKAGTFLTSAALATGVSTGTSWAKSSYTFVPTSLDGAARSFTLELRNTGAAGGRTVYVDSIRFVRQNESREIPSGQGFPTVGRYTNQAFYKEAHRRWGFFDGVRWVSDVYCLPFVRYSDSDDPPYSTASPPEVLIASVRGALDRWLEEWSVGLYVVGTNDASNYWEFRLVLLDSTGTEHTLAALDTRTLAPDTNTNLTTASFSPNPIGKNDRWVFLRLAYTGAPGGLYLHGCTLKVRDVLT